MPQRKPKKREIACWKHGKNEANIKYKSSINIEKFCLQWYETTIRFGVWFFFFIFRFIERNVLWIYISVLASVWLMCINVCVCVGMCARICSQKCLLCDWILMVWLFVFFLSYFFMTIIVTLSNPSSLVEIAGAVVVVAAVFFALRFIFPGMYISLHRFSATPSPSRVYCQRKMIFCWNSVWQKEKTKYYFLNGNLFFCFHFLLFFTILFIQRARCGTNVVVLDQIQQHCWMLISLLCYRVVCPFPAEKYFRFGSCKAIFEIFIA